MFLTQSSAYRFGSLQNHREIVQNVKPKGKKERLVGHKPWRASLSGDTRLPATSAHQMAVSVPGRSVASPARALLGLCALYTMNALFPTFSTHNTEFWLLYASNTTSAPK